MDSLVSAIAHHGYSILFGAVFLEVIGVPVPAAPMLLIAGAASAHGPLSPGATLATALGAMLLGDTLMYLMGRFTGWWLLGILCRLSISPESCILRSADAFYKRGRAVLAFSKFVPGISALAAPLAGSMRMKLPSFLAFDALGALLYTLAYGGAGYLFSGFLGVITKGYEQFGSYAVSLAALVFAGYLVYRGVLVLRERRREPVARLRPHEISPDMAGVAVYDVRSHGYYEKDTMRIRGSARLEPNGLNQDATGLPKDKQIVLYCTCVREATSVQVARVLTEQGYRVSVIAGGLRAWKRAGLPLEPVPGDDIVQLPTFS